MKGSRWLRMLLATAGLVIVVSAVQTPRAQEATATMMDEAAPPGENYDKAEFRLWYPNDVTRPRAIVILVPGSNGDGRPEAADPVWQEFARRHRLALVGCRFTDKPHDQNFIEAYVDAAHGSGQALLDALSAFAKRAQHPELTTAPLLLWGMSAGGEFNYEFVAWRPERVAAFVVNKGGIYYTALTPRGARDVPGILFVGGKDLEFRTNTIVGLFAVNRRAGALWALAEEPGAAHVVGRSRDMSLIFFEDVLDLRLGEGSGGTGGTDGMKRLSEKEGFLGDPKAKTFQPAGSAPAPNRPTAWLPSLRVARAWQALLTDAPFER